MATKKKMLQAAAGAGGGPEGAWDLSYAYYDDPNGWDLSTARYSGKSFDVSATGNQPFDLFFRADGIKMYILAYDGDDVNEYDLSTAWDVTTASYLQTFSIASQETQPFGLSFKPDGTKMYVVGSAGLDVNEYDLSTAWDISTASFSQATSLGARPSGLVFHPDGTKMYFSDLIANTIREYDLSTAWDTSTITFLQSFDISAQDGSPYGLAFKSDGTKMYFVGADGDDVNEYNLSTAWDISTSSFVQNFSVNAQQTSPYGLFIHPNGLSFYITGSASPRNVYQYTLGGFSVAAQENQPKDVAFNPDGTEMYIIGFGGDDVSQYSLSTEWDTSTAVYLQRFYVGSQETFPTGLFFKPDGTKMYVIGFGGDEVNEYDLSTAWDVSTAAFIQLFSVAAQELGPSGLFFKPDGTKMYITGSNGDDVNEYNLSTAWDISTAVFLQLFSVQGQETNPTDLFFKPDGTKMYILGISGDDVNEYDLSIAWDVSSSSFVQAFRIFSQASLADGLFFKPDGTKMFVVGGLTDRVFTYSLGVQE